MIPGPTGSIQNDVSSVSGAITGWSLASTQIPKRLAAQKSEKTLERRILSCTLVKLGRKGFENQTLKGWLRRGDLNHRPLGYELVKGRLTT
jgi:hypothetical protein